uniref:hypothetical protein n=1 Tax=Algoriphagus sp. TaxID=1872435 RepID=UPI004048795D
MRLGVFARVILFFASAEAEDYFFSRGSKRKNNADQPFGKQKICGPFLLNQREKKSRPKQRGIESSPLRLSCFAALREFFISSAAADKSQREMEEGSLKT